MLNSVAVTCVLIVLARVTDVSLDTVRTAAIIQGRRLFSAVLGFFEALIYVSVVAKVLLNIDHPVYTIAYAVGFASGTFLGIVIEQRLAFGNQVVSLFTRRGNQLAESLVAAGYLVAEVRGLASHGEITILYVGVPRKRSRLLIRDARAVDAHCYCVVNDVRMSGAAASAIRAAQTLSQDRVPMGPFSYERSVPNDGTQ